MKNNIIWNEDWEILIDFNKKVPKEVVNEINQIIYKEEIEEIIKDTKFCIILGSESCKYRVDKAVELWKKEDRPNITFIVTGANKTKEQGIEAYFMRKILLKNGISKNKIIVENKATNSKENIENVIKIIKNNIKKEDIIAIVTASFHQKRVEEILKEKINKMCQYKIISAEGQNTKKNNWYKNKKGRKIVYDELKK